MFGSYIKFNSSFTISKIKINEQVAAPRLGVARLARENVQNRVLGDKMCTELQGNKSSAFSVISGFSTFSLFSL